MSFRFLGLVAILIPVAACGHDAAAPPVAAPTGDAPAPAAAPAPGPAAPSAAGATSSSDAGSPRPRRCGGIGGFPCPGGFVCAPDPTEGCDPAKGGRDCSGVCTPSDAGVAF